jgi:hypothetical protein
VPPLGDVPAHPPHPAQTGTQAKPGDEVTGPWVRAVRVRCCPVEGLPEVVQLGLGQSEGRQVPGLAHCLQPLREVGVVPRVLCLDGVRLAGGLDLLPGEGADGLQQRHPRLAVESLGDVGQARVHQLEDRLQRVRGPTRYDVPGRDGGDRFEVATTGEHTQPAEVRLLCRREQLVGPGDGVSQRPLPRRHQPARRCDVECLVEPGEERLRAEHTDS